MLLSIRWTTGNSGIHVRFLYRALQILMSKKLRTKVLRSTKIGKIKFDGRILDLIIKMDTLTHDISGGLSSTSTEEFKIKNEYRMLIQFTRQT